MVPMAPSRNMMRSERVFARYSSISTWTGGMAATTEGSIILLSTLMEWDMRVRRWPQEGSRGRFEGGRGSVGESHGAVAKIIALEY